MKENFPGQSSLKDVDCITVTALRKMITTINYRLNRLWMLSKMPPPTPNTGADADVWLWGCGWTLRTYRTQPGIPTAGVLNLAWRAFKILDVWAASKSESLGVGFRPRSFLKFPGTLNMWLRFRTTPFKALVPAKTGASKTLREPKSPRDLLMAQTLVQ